MGSTLGLEAQHFSTEYPGVGSGLWAGRWCFLHWWWFIHQECRMFIIDIYKSRPLKRNCHNENIDSLEVIYMKYLPRVKDGQTWIFLYISVNIEKVRRWARKFRGKHLWCISHCLVNIINTILFINIFSILVFNISLIYWTIYIIYLNIVLSENGACLLSIWFQNPDLLYYPSLLSLLWIMRYLSFGSSPSLEEDNEEEKEDSARWY